MSHGNVSDKNVRFNVDEEDKFKPVINKKKEEDGVTEMSLVFKFGIYELLKHSENTDKHIIVKKTLLVGQYYTPYCLQISMSPSPAETSELTFFVSVTRIVEHQFKEHYGLFTESKPLCALWIEENNRRIPFPEFSGECKLWKYIQTVTQKLDLTQGYSCFSNFWFKVINNKAPPHRGKCSPTAM